jgi:ribosomal protein S17E
MTPKEKAQELFDKYYRLFNNFPNYQYVIENLNTIQDEKLYTTKQCALIAVDEILNEFPQGFKGNFEEMRKQYWKEVKKEIEAL